jgi:hypothetical protein
MCNNINWYNITLEEEGVNSLKVKKYSTIFTYSSSRRFPAPETVYAFFQGKKLI